MDKFHPCFAPVLALTPLSQAIPPAEASAGPTGDACYPFRSHMTKISGRALQFLFMAFLAFANLRSFGQTNAPIGLQPLGSYADGGLDKIGLANLGTHIDIPLYDHPGRGDGMGTKVHFVYDTNYYGQFGLISDVGWRVVSGTATPGQIIESITYEDDEPEPCYHGETNCTAESSSRTYSFSFIDSTGYAHPFLDASSVSCIHTAPQDCTIVPINAGRDTQQMGPGTF